MADKWENGTKNPKKNGQIVPKVQNGLKLRNYCPKWSKSSKTGQIGPKYKIVLNSRKIQKKKISNWSKKTEIWSKMVQIIRTLVPNLSKGPKLAKIDPNGPPPPKKNIVQEIFTNQMYQKSNPK